MITPQQSPDMPISFQKGELPILVSFPHSGTVLPSRLRSRMTEQGRRLPDTDWELPRLYNFIAEASPSIISAEFSRYVIDPNRSTDGINLYPGRPTPKICPTATFNGDAIYQSGQEPDDCEIEERTKRYWVPYHSRIRSELDRLRDVFGLAVIFDAHSIRSEVPRLFDGKLPDISIGTANGTACDWSLEHAIEGVLQRQTVCSYVMNGRFIGGHITRHYGRPSERIHAVQLELAQCRYMDEQRTTWDDEAARTTREILKQIFETIASWARSQCSLPKNSR